MAPVLLQHVHSVNVEYSLEAARRFASHSATIRKMGDDEAGTRWRQTAFQPNPWNRTGEVKRA
eukprot:3192502-Pyramimonas_sp.AAC.1